MARNVKFVPFGSNLNPVSDQLAITFGYGCCDRLVIVTDEAALLDTPLT